MCLLPQHVRQHQNGAYGGAHKKPRSQERAALGRGKKSDTESHHIERNRIFA